MTTPPWNARPLKTTHFKKYRDLLDLHSLNSAWLSALNLEAPKSQSSDWATCLSYCHGRSESDLEQFLGADYAEEFLSRLSQAVWQTQASIATLIPPGMMNALGQASQIEGRACALKRWRSDLRVKKPAQAFALLDHGPFGGSSKHALIVRSMQDELQLEWLNCPHQSPHELVRQHAEVLCELRTHWIRGFTVGFCPNLIIDWVSEHGKKRCRERWLVMQSLPASDS